MAYDFIRYEINVSDELEMEWGYEVEIGGCLFRMTSSPECSYRCDLDEPFYGHNEAFKVLSNEHRDEVIMLTGDGKDRRDFWCKYFFNGRMQREQGRIVYPEFDASKLKPID